jgi:MoaD family protein
MKVRLFAALRDVVGASVVEVDAPNVAALLAHLSRTYGPAFDRIMAAGTVVVDGETVGSDRTLGPSDEVALLPPVSGGRPMAVGMGLPNPVPGIPGTRLVEWAGRAEEAGFAALATIDRIAYSSFESLVTLAAAAGVTQRVELMTNVLLGPTRNPVLLAKEAATVDQLSGGRLTLGLGVGSRPDDYEAVELGFGDRGKRFDAQLELMHRVWRGELLAGARKPIGPSPIRGTVPVLVGGSTDKAIERTVRWGVGWTVGGAAPDRARTFAERVRTAWAESGRDGVPRLVALTYFGLGENAEEAATAYLSDYYGQGGRALALIVPKTEDALAGTITNFADAGFDLLVLVPTGAELDQIDRAAQIAFA